MCLAYFKVPDMGPMNQFEDDVKNKFDYLGLDHGSPDGIQRLIEQFGLRDNLTLKGRLEDIDRALSAVEFLQLRESADCDLF